MSQRDSDHPLINTCTQGKNSFDVQKKWRPIDWIENKRRQPQKPSEDDQNKYYPLFKEVLKLNDERKRAKTKFLAAKLEYENAKTALNKKKSQILEMFKDMDSDEISSRSDKWKTTTIEENKEKLSCLKENELDWK